jgi:alkanesulfonate monooxygenase SsuD/methylene tetrahydromethanopterin reductase-like flavin-dependent oxidoreductase (luciferase family)
MDVWYHNENTYPFVPQEVLDRADSVRASLPNKYCDPRIAADLFEETLDEFMLCDDQGLNVVAIEHHAGINSLFGANPLILGILARQTRKVRILSLGTLISLRPDPVRVAEEYATADVISRGRLEIGFVKSGGSEMASNNANPVNNVERYWEAIDLITKALTAQEGPFRWEGKHYTHRHVNIWPRPWQQPHPRMWAATGDPATASEVGRRGMVNVLVLRGEEGTKRAWAAYRQAREEAGLPHVTTDHFAYAAMVYVGDTHEEGVRVGSKLLWFLNTSLKSAPQYSKFLPGAVPPQFAPQVYRTTPQPTTQSSGSDGNGVASGNAGRSAASAGRNAAALIGITAEEAMARGILFAGSPDTVYQQIMDFYDKVGGFGHLVMIGRSGFMTHAEAETSIKLIAKEVLPRLQEITPVTVG